MKWFKTPINALAVLLGTAGVVALAAGLYTNGLPIIGAATVNGTAATAPNGVYTQTVPKGYALVPVDTNIAQGVSPQTVAAYPWDLASVLLDGLLNSTTSTAGAATLNTLGGVVVTESLTTAVGSTYTFTLTNSLVTTSSTPRAAIYSKTNTGGQQTNGMSGMTLTSVTAGSGSVVFVWTNNGTAALNGTMAVVFHL